MLPALLLLVIDSFYLMLMGPKFAKNVAQIQQQPMRVKFSGAVVSYLSLWFLLERFIFEKQASPEEAFLLGFGVYTVFDATNYALFEKYSLTLAIMDAVWGGILFYLVTRLTYEFQRFATLRTIKTKTLQILERVF